MGAGGDKPVSVVISDQAGQKKRSCLLMGGEAKKEGGDDSRIGKIGGL